MRSETFEFTGHGGHRLAGRLELPGGPPRATAVFAHCFACSKDLKAARRITRRLAALGFAVLRFDFTGLGRSDGEFGATGFEAEVEDVVEAARALAARDMAPQLLVGHSFGGAAVLAAAEGIESVRAVATIGAPSDPGDTLRHLGTALEEIEATGSGTATIAGRSFEISAEFIRRTRGARLEEVVGGLGRAILVLHAPRDEVVGIDAATRIFTAAKHPKSFVSLDDADHLLTDDADADYAAEVIAAWAARYVDRAEPPEPEGAPEGAPEGVVRVTEADPEGFRQEIMAGRHALAADEPASVGGTDSAPTPYGLLAAGLGACTTMTLRMYAGRKGLPLTRVSVDVTHGKVHAEDCADCGEGRQGRIDRFERVVTIEGPELTGEQRARLLEIADRCPVHRTLEASAVIVTREG